MQNYQSSGIIYTSINDHFPVFSSFSIPQCNDQCSHIKITKRVFHNDSVYSFQSKLSQYNWPKEINGKSVNDPFGTYINFFTYLYNDHFPVKQITIKEKTLWQTIYNFRN